MEGQSGTGGTNTAAPNAQSNPTPTQTQQPVKQQSLSDFSQRKRTPIQENPAPQPEAKTVSPFLDQKPQAKPTQEVKPASQETQPQGTETQEPSPFLEEQAPTMSDQEMIAAFRELQESGVLPLDRFGDLKIEVTDPYGSEMLTINQLKEGNLRQRDYTNKTMELAKHRDTFVQEATKFQDHMKSLAEDPVKFGDSMELNFGYEHMLKFATHFAQQHQQAMIQAIGAGKAAREMARMQLGLAENSRDHRLDQAEQQAHDQMVQTIQAQRKATLEAGHRTREQEKWEAQQAAQKQEAESKAQYEKWSKQYDAVAGHALKSVGLNIENPEVASMFRKCVAEVLNHTGAPDITLELAKKAAVHLQERTREWRAQWMPKSQQPVTGSRQAGSGGAPRQQTVKQQRLSEYQNSKFKF